MRVQKFETVSKTDKLKAIRDEVLALSGTELYDFRVENNSFPVIGQGSHGAKIMMIGEAPGRNEAKTGKPFCGTAGKILDDLLESIDLPRENVYITNIIKDRPPNNRDPFPDEIELYAPFLDRQIDIIKPEIVVTLGRFSMVYIMKIFNLEAKLEPISTAHGKCFEAVAQYDTINIIPLYHPAAAIYNRNLIDTLKKDFLIIKNQLIKNRKTV